ncbi:MAG: hypothetical protein BWY93_02128 [Euryarchaeota archaeon ADurb.BinA087]|nr:MAG: hypothetical protein BWY93_02128 [Euryarchaeota archaeon ADurb.BinA087]
MITACSGSISTTLYETIWGWRNGSPIIMGTVSFFTTGKSINAFITFGLLLTGMLRGRSSGGARTTLRASISSRIATIFTLSPMLTPVLVLVKLSILTLFWFQSSTRERQTLATVRRFPSTATMSPGDIFRYSIVSGSSRAFPPP